MISISEYLRDFEYIFPEAVALSPWQFIQELAALLTAKIKGLGTDYIIKDGVAIHATATIEPGAVLKAPVIIDQNCFVGAHAYLRGGVYLGASTVIGTGCELKTSVLMSHAAIAHFNFIGDSLIGSKVNFEAGAVTANHYNELRDKEIRVVQDGSIINTQSIKFGALVGDFSKIGANAVLSPGTLLVPGSVVKRLALIQQYLPESG
jgi:bifunctional N-acetylglucosamine-1-phosphate-uridyltransferase/glucosamine-1-phosphate-acetyltransferase GlmU-like protein